jgi:quercetin dioxygenase-like cupin family protein
MLFIDRYPTAQMSEHSVQRKGKAMASTRARILGPHDGEAGRLGSIGVRFMIDGAESGGGFSMVEHPMPARALAAPLHRHNREDEYSYVLDGRLGALLGDEVVFAEPGDLVFKPRGQWHTFWNAGDTPARILELISPAGFEDYFRELVEMLRHGAPTGPERTALASRYGLDVDPASIPRLIAQHGLVFGPPATPAAPVRPAIT